MLIHLLGSDSIKAKLLLCRWLEHTDDGGGHTMEGKRGPSLQIVDHHLAPGLRWLSKHCLHCSFILGLSLSLFLFFFAFYLSLLCLLFLSRPLSIFLCSPSLLVNCPNQQSLLLFIVSLHWLSSWQWWPSMRGCRLYLPIWGSKIGNLSHFLCKSHKLHVSRWRILLLPSCIWCILPSNTCILRTYHEFPKMGVTYSK